MAQAFTNGARSPPGMTEGINIARTVVNDLDSARFDPLLVKAVAKNASSSLELMLQRADGLVSLPCIMQHADTYKSLGCERPFCGHHDRTVCNSWSDGKWPTRDLFISLLVSTRKVRRRPR